MSNYRNSGKALRVLGYELDTSSVINPCDKKMKTMDPNMILTLKIEKAFPKSYSI